VTLIIGSLTPSSGLNWLALFCQLQQALPPNGSRLKGAIIGQINFSKISKRYISLVIRSFELKISERRCEMIIKRNPFILAEFKHFKFRRFFRFYGRFVPNGKFRMTEIFDFLKIAFPEVPSARGWSAVNDKTFLAANHVSWLFKAGIWESASTAPGGRGMYTGYSPFGRRASHLCGINDCPATAGVNRVMLAHCRISWNTQNQI